MSRRSRLHVPGGVYYVVQRSNARQPIFTEEADYATFERLLSTMLVRCRVRAHAYSWESDAIHLVLQISDMPVGRLIQRPSSQYARRPPPPAVDPPPPLPPPSLPSVLHPDFY